MTKNTPVFKNSQGVYYVKALFYEETFGNKDTCVYTLSPEDKRVNDKLYKSFRRLYVECQDPSEYSFANKYLAGWAHWKKFLESPWFRPYLLDLREELHVSLASQGLSTILRKAGDPESRDQVSCSKYLIEKGWEKKPKGGVGRTTKDKIKKEAQSLMKDASFVTEDFKRLQLN